MGCGTFRIRVEHASDCVFLSYQQFPGLEGILFENFERGSLPRTFTPTFDRFDRKVVDHMENVEIEAVNYATAGADDVRASGRRHGRRPGHRGWQPRN